MAFLFPACLVAEAPSASWFDEPGEGPGEITASAAAPNPAPKEKSDEVKKLEKEISALEEQLKNAGDPLEASAIAEALEKKKEQLEQLKKIDVPPEKMAPKDKKGKVEELMKQIAALEEQLKNAGDPLEASAIVEALEKKKGELGKLQSGGAPAASGGTTGTLKPTHWLEEMATTTPGSSGTGDYDLSYDTNGAIDKTRQFEQENPGVSPEGKREFQRAFNEQIEAGKTPGEAYKAAAEAGIAEDFDRYSAYGANGIGGEEGLRAQALQKFQRTHEERGPGVEAAFHQGYADARAAGKSSAEAQRLATEAALNEFHNYEYDHDYKAGAGDGVIRATHKRFEPKHPKATPEQKVKFQKVYDEQMRAGKSPDEAYRAAEKAALSPPKKKKSKDTKDEKEQRGPSSPIQPPNGQNGPESGGNGSGGGGQPQQQPQEKKSSPQFPGFPQSDNNDDQQQQPQQQPPPDTSGLEEDLLRIQEMIDALKGSEKEKEELLKKTREVVEAVIREGVDEDDDKYKAAKQLIEDVITTVENKEAPPGFSLDADDDKIKFELSNDWTICLDKYEEEVVVTTDGE